jgi:hypothetical protein
VEKPAPTSIPTMLTRRRMSYLLIFLVTLVGKFLFASQFGLYEDDYLQILPFYGTRWDQVLGLVWNDLCTWPHGEPIGFAVADLHAYLVTRFDTLIIPYLLGLFLVALNGCLFYRLARTIASDFASLIAACVFVLYPADTSEQIIMNQPWQLMNLTIILLAFLLYRRRRIVSYGLGLCSLLIYEHFFFPFAAAPFLIERGERFSLRKCVSHGLYMALAGCCLILVRGFVGERRAQGVLTDPGQILWRIPSAIGIGLANSFQTIWSRSLDALLHGDFFSWSMIVLVAIYFLLALGWRSFIEPSAIVGYRSRQDWLIVAVGAVFAAAAGYVLSFRPDNYPPILNLGRLSGFNGPASIGVCLLIACGISMLLQYAAFGRSLFMFASVLVVGCLTVVGLYIQKIDYVESWAQQKSVLKQLLATSGSWKPDTTCIIDVDHSEAKQLETPGFSLTWLCFDLTYVPRYLIDFNALPTGRLPVGQTLQPSEAGYSQLTIRLLDRNLTYPRAIGYSKYSEVAVAQPGSVRLELTIADPLFRIFLKDGNFQLFRIRDRKLERVRDPIWSIADVQLRQDQAYDETRAPLPLSPVGKMLLGDVPLWPSVDGGRMYPTLVPFKDRTQ